MNTNPTPPPPRDTLNECEAGNYGYRRIFDETISGTIGHAVKIILADPAVGSDPDP